MIWRHYATACDLPDEWSDLTRNNIFLYKDFLMHLEAVNPCRQQYHLCYNHADQLLAGYVDYDLSLNLLTFSALKMKLPVRVMGVPCSVSQPGFAYLDGHQNDCSLQFQKHPGWKLILNSDFPFEHGAGQTLPNCRLEVKWPTFNTYLAAQRSHYRYRWQKAQKKWHGVNVQWLPPYHFTPEMYTLYENVYQKSAFKLEKQSLAFFLHMPLPAKLLVAKSGKKLLGFAMVIENKPALTFLFTGLNYASAPVFDTYHNLLLEIVRYGIHHDYRYIDFGQTAEDTKLKLGCTLIPKYFQIQHSQPLLQYALQKIPARFGYRAPQENLHVFK